MNVVIIPEDSRYDRLILEPILTQLFISLNKKNTRFYFDDDARRRGVSQTLDVDNLKLAIARFKHLQGAVVLLIVDRDGHNGRSGMTNRLARLANLKKAIGVDDFFPNENSSLSPPWKNWKLGSWQAFSANCPATGTGSKFRQRFRSRKSTLIATPKHWALPERQTAGAKFSACRPPPTCPPFSINARN